MEIRYELFQILIAATPLLVAIAVLFWAPLSQKMRKIKGILGVVLLFVPYWLVRSAIGTCTALGHICAPGEQLVRLHPPYWGIGAWDCEQCASSVSAVFLKVNSLRPTLIPLLAILTVMVASLVLRQCWRSRASSDK
jgi:hypothetical protein